jgi:hypothetical protein
MEHWGKRVPFRSLTLKEKCGQEGNEKLFGNNDVHVPVEMKKDFGTATHIHTYAHTHKRL